MQALIELIAGFVALLAASALAQFGVDVASRAETAPEVRRISDDCGQTQTPAAFALQAGQDC